MLAVLAALSILGVGVAGTSGLMAGPTSIGTMNGGMMNGGNCGMNGGMHGGMHDGGTMNGSCPMEQMQDHMQNCTMQMSQDQCQCQIAP